MPSELDQARLDAGVDLLRRCGARSITIGHSDLEGAPGITFWYCSAQVADQEWAWDVAAARDPLTALSRLLEQLIDGSPCRHCGKPAAFDPDMDIVDMPPVFTRELCVYAWDPELKVYRRGCA